MPTVSNYYVSRPLANFALGYTNADFIAETVFPVAPVDDPTGFYWSFGQEVFTAEDDYVADRARANAVEHDFTRITYNTRPYALNHDVSWKERDAAARSNVPGTPYRRATMVVAQKLALGRELVVSGIVRSTTNITQNTTLSGTAQWSDYSGTSNPLTVSQTAINTIRGATGGTGGITAIIPYAVFDKLRYHPAILDKMTITQTKILTQDLLATLLGVDRVLIPASIYNTANPGQTAVMTDVWGKDVIYARLGAGPNLDMQLNLGRIFRLNWASVGGLGAESRQWTEEDRKTDVVEVGFEEDRKLVSPLAAYLVKTAVA
jgi:hypothetical protein